MAEKKAKTEATAETTSEYAQENKKEKKQSRWTLDLCKKYARRFDSAEAWAKGAPACYKAAVAHGWEKECVKVMQAPVNKVKTTKAPTKKTGRNLPRAS